MFLVKDVISRNFKRRSFSKSPRQLHINEAGQLCFFPMDNSSMDGGKSAKTLQKAVEVMVSKLLQGTNECTVRNLVF